MTNPFLPAQPAVAPSAPAGNPFGPANPATTTNIATNPYGPSAPVATQAAPPALDLSRLAAAPAPVVGEGGGAQLPDMFGRLALFFPLRNDRVPPFKGTESKAADGMRDRLTATVVILDDGRGGQSPIRFGGEEHKMGGRPHTQSSPLPYVRKAMWLYASRIISQLRDSLPMAPGQAPGMVAGRITKAGQEEREAWYLIGANEAEVTLVRQYLEAVQAGQFPHPLA